MGCEIQEPGVRGVGGPGFLPIARTAPGLLELQRPRGRSQARGYVKREEEIIVRVRRPGITITDVYSYSTGDLIMAVWHCWWPVDLIYLTITYTNDNLTFAPQDAIPSPSIYGLWELGCHAMLTLAVSVFTSHAVSPHRGMNYVPPPPRTASSQRRPPGLGRIRRFQDAPMAGRVCETSRISDSSHCSHMELGYR